MNQTSSIPQSLNLNSGTTTNNTTTNNNSSSSLNNNNNNDSQSNLKRAFDLEPNPFEQSFATNDDENTQNIDPKNLNSNKNYPLKLPPLSQQGKNNTTITTNTTTNTNTNANPINKSNTLPQGSPPILTPGGTRRVHNNVLPPLPMLSPGSTSIPGTPMWLQGSTGLSSSNLNFNFLPSLNRQPSTNNTNTNNINSSSGAAIKNGNSDTNGNSSLSSSASSSSSSNNNNNNITNTSTNSNNIPNSNTTNSNSNNSNNNNNNTNSISIPNSSGSNNNPAAYNQFVMNLKKTGLTPFESSLRTGLTPSIPGVPPPLNSNPSANTISMFLGLPSGPMTPTGFSSLLGITSTTPNKTPIPGISSSNQHNHPQQQPNLNGINTTNTTNSVNMQLKLPEPGSLHNSNPVKLEQPYQVVPGSSNSSSTTISASVSAQNTPDLKIKNGNSLTTTTTTATSSLDIPQPITTTPSTATNKNKRGKKTDTSVSKSNKRKLSTDKKSANKTTSKKSKTSKPNGNNYNYDEDNEDDDDNDDNDDNDDGENSSKGQTQEEKRKNFLERNRVAASKCRQRKKQMVEKMHVDLQFYSSQYESLNQQVRTLRDQVIGLRSVLFAHKDCPNLLDQVGGYDNLNIYLNNADFVISHSAQQQQQQQQHQPNQQQQE